MFSDSAKNTILLLFFSFNDIFALKTVTFECFPDFLVPNIPLISYLLLCIHIYVVNNFKAKKNKVGAGNIEYRSNERWSQKIQTNPEENWNDWTIVVLSID